GDRDGGDRQARQRVVIQDRADTLAVADRQVGAGAEDVDREGLVELVQRVATGGDQDGRGRWAVGIGRDGHRAGERQVVHAGGAAGIVAGGGAVVRLRRRVVPGSKVHDGLL